MSNDSPPPSGDPSAHQHQPNWGSAYPPPGGYPPPGSGYPPPSGFPPPGYGYGYQPYPVAPKHPSASTAMVLGIVGIVGGLMCWLPLLMSPFAWVVGAKALNEIRASNGAQSGEGEALAGKVLGIIGTVLLALGIAAIVALIVLSLTIDDFWDDGDYATSDPGSYT